MTNRLQRFLSALMLGLVFAAGLIQPARAGTHDRAVAALQYEVRLLRDREEIRQLLIDYGRTLDNRDFEGFAKLFAADGEYVSGPGMTTRGGKAAADMLRGVMASNPMGFRSPNYHVFFNEVIDIDGDRATATSMSLFVVPSDANQPQPVLMATYDDELVREGGAWKFRKRVVKGTIPAPRAP